METEPIIFRNLCVYTYVQEITTNEKIHFVAVRIKRSMKQPKPNAWRVVGKRDPSSTVGITPNLSIHSDNQYGKISKKSTHRPTLRHSFTTL